MTYVQSGYKSIKQLLPILIEFEEILRIFDRIARYKDMVPGDAVTSPSYLFMYSRVGIIF